MAAGGGDRQWLRNDDDGLCAQRVCVHEFRAQSCGAAGRAVCGFSAAHRGRGARPLVCGCARHLPRSVLIGDITVERGVALFDDVEADRAQSLRKIGGVIGWIVERRNSLILAVAEDERDSTARAMELRYCMDRWRIWSAGCIRRRRQGITRFLLPRLKM